MTASVGQVVTVPISVHNPGPDTLPTVALRSLGVLPGAQYVGGSSCTENGGTLSCERKYLAAGASYTVDIRLRVTGCPPNLFSGVQFSFYWADNGQSHVITPQRATVGVAGCGPPAANGGAGADPTATPAPEPLATSGPEPTQVVASSIPERSAVAEVAAAATRSAGGPRAELIAGLGGAVFVGSAGCWRRSAVGGRLARWPFLRPRRPDPKNSGTEAPGATTATHAEF